MNILGVDFGTKRMGLAWVNKELGVVLPFGNIHEKDKIQMMLKLAKIIKEEKTENPDYVNVTEEKVENNLVESKRQKILTLIEKFDTNSGADILQVIEESKFDKKEANDIIDELIKEGEIFQIKVGRLKLIN